MTEKFWRDLKWAMVANLNRPTQKALVLGESKRFDKDQQVLYIGKGGLEQAAELAMNTGQAYGLVPFMETDKKYSFRIDKDFPDDEEGIVYINGKILTPETVRAINRTPVTLDPEVDKYVITTWGGIKPFREGVDKVITTPKRKI